MVTAQALVESGMESLQFAHVRYDLRNSRRYPELPTGILYVLLVVYSRRRGLLGLGYWIVGDMLRCPVGTTAQP